MPVTATAPDLSPKTWYGMPACGNADGKVVVFFQDAANFDDEDLWPVSSALQEWSAVVEKKVIELVTAAISSPLPRPPHVALLGQRCGQFRLSTRRSPPS